MMAAMRETIYIAECHGSKGDAGKLLELDIRFKVLLYEDGGRKELMRVSKN